MKKTLFVITGILLAGAALAATPRRPALERGRDGRGSGAVPGDVPNRFRDLYADLQGTLQGFIDSLSRGPASRGGVTFGGEVLPANAHRGEGLLSDKSALQGSVRYVEGLQALGAGGVSLSLSYPLMAKGYPRSDEYWAFYRQLTQEIRKRGLKLHIKTGPMFTEKEFTSVKTDYSNLTAPRYFSERSEMNQRIAADLHPDYLSIGNEPSSEMQVLKLKFTADDYTKYLNDCLRGMNRRGVAVGAGTGNWDSTDYVKKFARETDLDYIDIHVYPLATEKDNYLQRAVDMAEIARNSRKRLVVGEAWLYKASRKDLRGNPTAAKVFMHDAYSFWAPLDTMFLEAMGRFAQAEGIEYVSPFWTKYFFAYVDFNKAGLFNSPQSLGAKADKAMVEALMAKNIQFSEAGEAYRNIASRYR